MAFCQVRVAMPLSVPVRYALAICRLSTGWRSELFLASTICCAASALGIQSDNQAVRVAVAAGLVRVK